MPQSRANAGNVGPYYLDGPRAGVRQLILRCCYVTGPHSPCERFSSLLRIENVSKWQNSRARRNEAAKQAIKVQQRWSVNSNGEQRRENSNGEVEECE